MILLSLSTDISIMDIVIMVCIILVIFAVGMFYKKVAPAADKITDKQGLELSLRESNAYELAIDDILNRLRIEIQATDIYIGRFHNGGNFVNGTRMKKFSVTYCKASSQQKELVSWYMYDKFTSHWPGVFDQLYAMGEYYCPNIQESKDSNFRRDMSRFDFKSIYIYLICQPDAMKTPEAFLAVNYRDFHVSEFAKEERDCIKEAIPKLLALMNLVPLEKNRK
jgi:hypothetical protein